VEGWNICSRPLLHRDLLGSALEEIDRIAKIAESLLTISLVVLVLLSELKVSRQLQPGVLFHRKARQVESALLGLVSLRRFCS
jgi:hypothetical protein